MSNLISLKDYKVKQYNEKHDIKPLNIGFKKSPRNISEVEITFNIDIGRLILTEEEFQAIIKTVNKKMDWSCG